VNSLLLLTEWTLSFPISLIDSSLVYIDYPTGGRIYYG